MTELTSTQRTLINRRRALKAKLNKLAWVDIAIDHVMGILDPGHTPEAPATNKPCYSSALPFAASEMTSLTLAALRRSGAPITATECTRAMILEKALPGDLQVRLADRVSAVP